MSDPPKPARNRDTRATERAILHLGVSNFATRDARRFMDNGAGSSAARAGRHGRVPGVVTATRRDYITSAEDLRQVISAPQADSLVWKKQLAALDAHCRAFIAKSPFALLATAGADGRCDVTPRGDGPGFVRVLDEQTLVIPERPGNRRIDSLLNIIANPHAGLLFLVPGVDETLRVNGRAAITQDPDLLAQLAVSGKVPQVAVELAVEEVFFHCARAFKRARLWEPGTWIERGELPTLGQIIVDQMKITEFTAAELDCSLEESNKRLY
jgi:PPOX class probable FMN-dependent enzyme